MTLECALKLGLKIYFTNIRAQKINSSTFKTFRMVLASFQIEDKFGKTRFFSKTILIN